MKLCSKTLSLAVCLAITAVAPAIALAQTTVGPVSIKGFSAAWNDEFAINTGSTLPNPANCQLSDMADASVSTVAGYKTYLATALTAVSSGQNVTLSLSNTSCSNGRPLIIGITINP